MTTNAELNRPKPLPYSGKTSKRVTSGRSVLKVRTKKVRNVFPVLTHSDYEFVSGRIRAPRQNEGLQRLAERVRAIQRDEI